MKFDHLVKFVFVVIPLSLIVFFYFNSFSENMDYMEESVSGFVLHSPASVQNKVGDSAWAQVQSFAPSNGKAMFSTKDRSQKLTLVFHPGGVKNSFSEIIVEYTKADNKLKKLKEAEFTSSKGVKLGLSKKELVSKLGKPSKKVKKLENTIFNYTLSDSEHPFLKKHNMPSYYGKYTFEDGKLIKFSFGFENP